MKKITAIIITKNEEKIIEDCLKSLRFVDEIIVIDSYSSDKTLEIAKKFSAKVFQHNFVNFSEMRNFALTKAKTDWILYIDADERVTPLLRKGIIKAIKDKNKSAYSFTRKNYYFGREWPYKETVTRLFLSDKLISWQGEIHESPQVKGNIGKIDGELLHYTHRSLEEMLNKTIEWSEIEARIRFQTNHPKVTWWRLIRVFLTGFFNSYIKQQGFKVGGIGFIESIYQGFSLFITYARLWEMQKEKKSPS